MIRKEDALHYHRRARKGKIEVNSTKPCATQRDLSLAYTPGVAEPCREIEKDPQAAYEYTAKGNLVAVITDGSAVLGLGKIGALAGKPVMEGKGVLFKRFADIDVFDIELNTHDPEEIIKACQLLEPTFGGINLEDIKAPECFHIEEVLKETMNIPVFHDDQHGTAIISGAALLNALEIAKKDISKVRVVYCGAGAAGIACAKLYLSLGVKPENMLMVDTRGVIYKGREGGMNKYKDEFVRDTNARTLADAMKDADVFCGVSVQGMLKKDMIKSMAKDPIVFAMANPDPEIMYDEAMSVRKDLIMATGRSDFPNQVNNVLGFPFIFRGALDVRAAKINEDMKVAATHALAKLAKEDVPEGVCNAYNVDKIKFGREYIIPKPFDPRVLLWEAPAVAKAAMDSGVAKTKIDLEEYKISLERIMGRGRQVMRIVLNKAKGKMKRIVFPEGREDKILRAAQILLDEKICQPILLGKKEKIDAMKKEMGIELNGAEIVEPKNYPRYDEYVKEFFKLRSRKGITEEEARFWISRRQFFGSMMVRMGDADGMVNGLTTHYPVTVKPALQVVKKRDDISKVAGLYIMVFKNKTLFFADTTVNIDPTAEELAEIAILAAETAKYYDVEPRVAMLSFSNFGSTPHPLTEKVAKAVKIVKEKKPDLIVDGEMQADTAVVTEILQKTYPFSSLKEQANVLIFPDLQSGNIAYKLMSRLGGAEAIGPILLGMQKPVNVLQRGASVNEIVNVASFTVVAADKQ